MNDCPDQPDPRITIRPLAPADAPLYMGLRREMLADSPWAFAASPESDRALKEDSLLQTITGPGSTIVGAFAAPSPATDAMVGQLLSVAGLHTNHHPKMAHRAHIWGAYTTPRARGRGLGHRVLRATLGCARAWPGITSVGLSASIRSTEAIRLYERLGFRRWGVEPGVII